LDENESSRDVTLNALLAAAAYQPPALENDAAARILGLVSDPSYALDSAALKQARMRAGLSTSALAQRLAARGWQVTAGEVFRWENRSGASLSPAMIAAIAHEVAVPEKKLVIKVLADPRRALRENAGFRQLAQRWADLQTISFSAALASLEQKSLATVHRGDAPDTERMLAAMTAFVEEIENRSST
jgi:transcriptional regulator with XRE-family HTH domain